MKFFSKKNILLVCLFIASISSTYIGSRVWIVYIEVQAENVQKNIVANFNAEEERSYWKNRYERSDATTVAREMTQKYAPIEDYRVQHTAAHILGSILYEHESLTGIQYCTDLSNFGCYHGFMGDAVSSSGNVRDIFPRIATSCAQLTTQRVRHSCFHGVGHGILGGLGYEISYLREALDICGSEKNGGFASACAAGVFMEYNARFLLHAPDIFASNPRPLNEKDPYDPCTQVNDFQSTCYYWQPDWWKVVNEHDFEEIGKWCDAIPNTDYRDECFKGTGKTIVWFFPRNIQRAKNNCALLPHEHARTLCLWEAAHTVIQRTQDVSLGEAVCTMITNNSKRKECEQSVQPL